MITKSHIGFGTLVVVFMVPHYACMATRMTLNHGKSRHHIHASIQKIKRATLANGTVTVEIDIRGHLKPKRQPVRLDITPDLPHWGFSETGLRHMYSIGGSLGPQDELIVANPLRLYARVSDKELEGVDRPIVQISCKDLWCLAEHFEKLSDGISIIALDTKKRSVTFNARFHEPPDMEQYDSLGVTLVIVSKKADMPIRAISIPYLHEYSERRRSWYALTPFSIATDIITSPIQLVFVLIFLATWE